MSESTAAERVAIALIGPTTARGEAVLAALQPFKDAIDVYGIGRDAGAPFEWRGPQIVQATDAVDWSSLRAVIAAEPLDATPDDLPVLHLHAAEVPSADVPSADVPVPQAVHADLPAHEQMPAPAARAVAQLLDGQSGIEQIDLTVLASASSADRPGMDELRDQTIALLNFKPVKTEAFPHRLAFDLLLDADATLEDRIAHDLATFCPAAPRAGVRRLIVPAFMGTAVDVRLRGAIDGAALRGVVEGLDLHADRLSAAAGSTRLHATRFEVSADQARVWLLFDDLAWGVHAPTLGFLARVLGANMARG